jgi:transcriptional regulator with XRE-family HTH domain
MEQNGITTKSICATICCGVRDRALNRTITDMETIHARIARLRVEKGLSKSALAKACGATYQAVQKWESGATAPKRARLSAVAIALGVSPQELAHGAPTTSQNAPKGDCRLTKIGTYWEWLTEEQKTTLINDLQSMAVANRAIAKELGGRFSTAKDSRVAAALKTPHKPNKK